MSLYLYRDRGTFLHRLDPRAKFVAIVVLFWTLLSFDHPRVQVAILALMSGLVTWGQAWPTVRRLRTVMILLSLSSILIWSLIGGGPTPLFWRITVESVMYGIGTSLKLINMIFIGSLFLSTTRNEEFMGGLLKLGLPYPVGFAFSTALRLVPTFVGSGMTIIEAQRSRGLDLSAGSLLERIRKHIPLLVPIVASAIRSTNQLAMAVESKAFGYSRRRTAYVELRFDASDWAAVIVLLGFLALMFWVKSTGIGLIAGFKGR